MQPDLKAEWVAALRSGKYRQAHQALRDGDCYCCLGVLCDVIDPTGWDGAVYDGEDNELSRHVRERAGITPEQMEDLMWLNDGCNPATHPNRQRIERHSFEQIAAHIEANL